MKEPILLSWEYLEKEQNLISKDLSGIASNMKLNASNNKVKNDKMRVRGFSLNPIIVYITL